MLAVQQQHQKRLSAVDNQSRKMHSTPKPSSISAVRITLQSGGSSFELVPILILPPPERVVVKNTIMTTAKLQFTRQNSCGRERRQNNTIRNNGGSNNSSNVAVFPAAIVFGSRRGTNRCSVSQQRSRSSI